MPKELKKFINELKTEGFKEKEIEFLKQAFVDKKDYSKYRDIRFKRSQMEVIKKGVDAGLDVTSYLDPQLSWQEMWDIYRDLLKKSHDK